jgi:rRNA maturation endonuclease Nob1
MGVIDRAKAMSGLTDPEDAGCSYICLACETAFEVQHHNCPACGSFDVRCSRWIQE